MTEREDWAEAVDGDSLMGVIIGVLEREVGYTDTTLAHPGEIILDGDLKLAPLVQAIEAWYAGHPATP